MDELTSRGVEHFNAGRFEEALRCFRESVASGRGGADAGVFLGHAAAAAGRADEAVEAFCAVIRSKPRHLPAYAGLAGALLREAPRRRAKAEAALSGLLALEPRDAAERRSLGPALRAAGAALRAVGDLKAAEAALSRALALSLAGADGAERELLEVACADAQKKLVQGRPEKAAAALRKVLRLSPADPAARRDLARLLGKRAREHFAAGRLSASEAALRRVLALSPRDVDARDQLEELLLVRAETLAAAAERDGDLAAAARAARRLPLSARRGALLRQLALVAIRRARGLAEAGRTAECGGAVRTALSLQARAGEGRRGRALMLRRVAEVWTVAGRPDLAERATRSAAALAPGDAELKRELARYARARADALDVPNAPTRRLRQRRAWRAVLRLDPKDGGAWLALSGLARWTGRPGEERAALRKALAGRLEPRDRFRVLVRLGRYARAWRTGEEILDAGARLEDLRAFWDPWEKDNRPDPSAPQADLAALARAPRGPWRALYVGIVGGAARLDSFEELPSSPRHLWMHYGAALELVLACRFERAERAFRAALEHPGMDWRAHGYLAEACLCQDKPEAAMREMALALPKAPAEERAQVLAWWGELELWIGRYESALARLNEAAEGGSPFSHAWKGAALLRLGRREEALAQLDAALRLFPGDGEARLWRAEAKRELGRPREALRELETVGAQHWVWVLFNAALAKRDVGDLEGMRRDLSRLPEPVLAHVARALGLPGARPEDDAAAVRMLEAAFTLARGFRRGEYAQAVWLSRPPVLEEVRS